MVSPTGVPADSNSSKAERSAAIGSGLARATRERGSATRERGSGQAHAAAMPPMGTPWTSPGHVASSAPPSPEHGEAAGGLLLESDLESREKVPASSDGAEAHATGSSRPPSLWSRVRGLWRARGPRGNLADPISGIFRRPPLSFLAARTALDVGAPRRMLTHSMAPSAVLPSTAELAPFLYGLSPEGVRFREAVKALLASPAFERRDGLTMEEHAKLSYERFKLLRDRLELRARDVVERPSRIITVLELVGAVDGTLFTVMSIHYCLCVGSILRHAAIPRQPAPQQPAPELARYLDELDSLDSVGTFLVTELGYGNNVVSLETRAEYDIATRELRLTTPSGRAAKFMPNTGLPGVPKIGVVMARLVVKGCDHGVFPVVLRLRTAGGACPGVSITPLGEKPGYALDNAMTSFQGVRVPKACLLLGSESQLSDDGAFESRIKSRRERFLSSMEQVQLGRIGLSAVGATLLGASSLIAIKYASQRKTFAPRHADVSVLEYKNHQRDVFTALAYAYASRLMVSQVMARCVFDSAALVSSSPVLPGGGERQPAPCGLDHDTTFRISGATKVHVSYAMERFARLCRERCGAAGLLEENRLSTYAAQAQGLITAEGDNQIVLIKIARQMLLGHGYTRLAKPSHARGLALRDPRRLIALLRSRERTLHRELKLAMAAAFTGRDLFGLWNENVNLAIEMATAHASRLVTEAFWERAQQLHPESPVRDLLSLYGLQELAPHLGYLLAEGLITREEVRLHGKELDRLCEKLQPRALQLAQALDIPNELLRAPIASDDYIADYAARLCAAPDITPAPAPASARRAPDGSRRRRSIAASGQGFTARTGLAFLPAARVQAEGRPETRDSGAFLASFRGGDVASGRH
jgi:acyl-CoA oxidase